MSLGSVVGAQELTLAQPRDEAACNKNAYRRWISFLIRAVMRDQWRRLMPLWSDYCAGVKSGDVVWLHS